MSLGTREIVSALRKGHDMFLLLFKKVTSPFHYLSEMLSFRFCLFKMVYQSGHDCMYYADVLHSDVNEAGKKHLN